MVGQHDTGNHRVPQVDHYLSSGVAGSVGCPANRRLLEHRGPLTDPVDQVLEISDREDSLCPPARNVINRYPEIVERNDCYRVTFWLFATASVTVTEPFNPISSDERPTRMPKVPGVMCHCLAATS